MDIVVRRARQEAEVTCLVVELELERITSTRSRSGATVTRSSSMTKIIGNYLGLCGSDRHLVACCAVCTGIIDSTPIAESPRQREYSVRPARIECACTTLPEVSASILHPNFISFRPIGYSPIANVVADGATRHDLGLCHVLFG